MRKYLCISLSKLDSNDYFYFSFAAHYSFLLIVDRFRRQARPIRWLRNETLTLQLRH